MGRYLSTPEPPPVSAERVPHAGLPVQLDEPGRDRRTVVGVTVGAVLLALNVGLIAWAVLL